VAYDRNRPRPTAYRDTNPGGLAARPIILASGRGGTKITPTEAVLLARDLVAAATRTAAAGDLTDWLLRLAERVAAQSEILTATANRKE
jgi:hypothetical protein